jgi:hypothetical protein
MLHSSTCCSSSSSSSSSSCACPSSSTTKGRLVNIICLGHEPVLAAAVGPVAVVLLWATAVPWHREELGRLVRTSCVCVQPRLWDDPVGT